MSSSNQRKSPPLPPRLALVAAALSLLIGTLGTGSIQPALNNWVVAEVGPANSVTAIYDGTTASTSLTAAATGIGEISDGVGFLYKRILDGGLVSGKISSVPGTDGAAGLMVRSSLRFDAANVYVSRTSSNELQISWRNTDGGITETRDLAGFNIDGYYQLQVVSSTVYLRQSTNAQAWLPVLAISVDLGNRVLGGAAASSGDLNNPITTVFDELNHRWTTAGLLVRNYDESTAVETGVWNSVEVTDVGLLNDDYNEDGNAGKGSKNVVFNLDPDLGWYETYLQWGPAEDLDSAVPVTVVSADGAGGGTATDDELELVQSAESGHWVYLGTYFFDPGVAAASLTISNTGTTERVAIDGVHLISANHEATPDSDSDTLPDWWELRHFQTLAWDDDDHLDGDSADNISEFQAGTDPNVDETTPASTTDTDGDGFSDSDENSGVTVGGVAYAPLSYREDSDGDLWADGYEMNNGHDPLDASDGTDQSGDNDGLSASEEFIYGTLSTDADSDGDGESDGDEVKVYGSDPADSGSTSATLPPSIDADRDDLVDSWEIIHFGTIAAHGKMADPDADGLSNFEEQSLGTAPNDDDSDDDQVKDREELVYGTDPTDTASVFLADAVIWTDHTNTSSDGLTQNSDYEGSALRKVSSSSSYNADAASMRHLPADGDGKLSFRAAQTNRRMFIGIAAADINNTYTSFTHSVYFKENGELKVCEGSTVKHTEATDYAAGELISIERNNGVVTFYRGGVLFYTSATVSSGAVIVDTCIYHLNGQFDDVRWSGAELAGDLDEDGLADGTDGSPQDWEEAIVNNDPADAITNITEVLPGDDYDGDGRTNLQEYLDRTDPTDAADKFVADAVIWTDYTHTSSDGLTQNSDYEGSALRKVSSSSSYNADAASMRHLPADGDGRLSFRAAQTNRRMFIGLATADINNTYTSFTHSVRFKEDGELRVYEGSTVKHTEATDYAAGELISIERNNGVVTFYRGGVLFYTSATVSSGAVIVDTCIYHLNGQFDDVRWSGAELAGDLDEDGLADGTDGSPPDWEEAIVNNDPADAITNITEVLPGDDYDGDGRTNLQEYLDRTDPTDAADKFVADAVIWTDYTHTSSDGLTQNSDYEGSALRKVSSSSSYNADAASMRHLPADGDGRLSFRAAQTNRRMFIGLATADINNTYTSFTHSVRFKEDGELRVYEGSTVKHTEATDYAAGELISIERNNGVVTFYRGGVLFYTSATVSSGAVIVDTCIYHLNGQFDDVRWSGAELAGDLDEDGLADGTDGSPPDWEEAIVNNDPADAITNITEVLPGDDYDGDGRTNLQEYLDRTDPTDAADKFVADAVIWTDYTHTSSDGLTQNSDYEGSALRKVSSSSSYNADAASMRYLPADGDGRLSFRAAQTNRRMFIGLATADINNTYTSFTHSVRFKEDGELRVYEGSTVKHTEATDYAAGELISVERNNGVVTFYRGGVLFYTSATVSSGSVIVDTCIYHLNGQFDDVRWSGALADEDDDGLEDFWEIEHFGNIGAYSGLDGANGGSLDNDGLTNADEYLAGTDPNDSDSDNDSLTDGEELNVYATDPNDPHSDADTLTDGQEVLGLNVPDQSGGSTFVQPGTDPKNADTDSDGLDDDVEVLGFPMTVDIDDGSGGTTTETRYVYPLPTESDTDKDGENDGVEVNTYGTDPTDPESDGVLDTDNDTLVDSWEVEYFGAIGTQNAGDDHDGEGLLNGAEQAHGTDPTKADTDGDEEDDALEILLNTDPLDPLDNSGDDADQDGMLNDWEDQHGLDKYDISDAGLDFDYDRLTNLEESLASTVPTAGWTFQAVPFFEVYSMNEHGDVVGSGNGGDLRVWTNGGPVVLDSSLPSSPQPDQTFLNNRGLVAASLDDPQTVGDELRIYRIDQGAGSQIATLAYESALPKAITDSGYVVGQFRETGATVKAFRWRAGTFEDLDSPLPGQNVTVVSGNERGEVIANVGDIGYLWKDGQWQGLGGKAIGINNLGRIALRKAAGDGYNYHLRQANGVVGFVATLAGSGSVATLGDNGDLLFQSSTGLLYRLDGSVVVLGDADPTHANRSPGDGISFIGHSINRYGEVAGSLFAEHQGTVPWPLVDPSNGSEPAILDSPSAKALLWRNGKLAVDGFNYDSRILRVTNSGFQLVASVVWEEDIQSAMWQATTANGIRIPANDSNGDGMPDDWFAHHGLAGLPDDDDGDGVSDRDEYIYFTDPGNDDTDGDSMLDGWEVTYGLSPVTAGDGGNDRDQDQLADLEEFLAGTDPLNPDTDGDGLTDGYEVSIGTDPTNADADFDGDGESDSFEISNDTDPLDPNSFTADTDNDLLPDAWETLHFGDLTTVSDPLADADGDQMSNGWELTYGFAPDNDSDGLVDSDLDLLINKDEALYGTDPHDQDSDDDGLTDGDEVHTHLSNPTLVHTDTDDLPDGWEVEHGFDPATSGTDATDDPDNDNLSNLAEYNAGTDPNDDDSDEDGFDDGWEVQYQFDPTVHGTGSNTDPDSDGLTNAGEYLAGTNPRLDDSDGDNLEDGEEVTLHQTDPAEADSDGDGLNDDVEIELGTDPNESDSDGDDLSDADELDPMIYGTDPLVADTDKDGENDGLEVTNMTDPLDPLSFTVDGDSDDLPDAWEVLHFGDIFSEMDTGDHDQDGLDNVGELAAFSDPTIKDTDGDSLEDGPEVHTHGTDPTNPDTDGDGLNDAAEINEHLTDATEADSDDDDLTDFDEIYKHFTNPNAADSDGDSIEDGDELLSPETDPNKMDTDGDGERDDVELANGTDPADSASFHVNTDNDGLPDAWEILYFGDITSWGALDDPDSDTLNNFSELSLGTNPGNEDTDGDSYRDDWEVLNGYDPLDPAVDFDGDGLPEPWELYYFGTEVTQKGEFDPDRDGADNVTEWLNGTDPSEWDSDEDGWSDGFEIDYGSDPNDDQSFPADADNNGNGDGLIDGWEIEFFGSTSAQDGSGDFDSDGLSNLDEQTHGTDPTDPDSDDDYWTDGWEVANGKDPLLPYDGLADSDRDGLGIGQEMLLGTNPDVADTDDDGENDGYEVDLGTDPTDENSMTGAYGGITYPAPVDADNDGILDDWEIANGFDPTNRDDALLDSDSDQLSLLGEFIAGTEFDEPDTDGDTYNDGLEVKRGWWPKSHNGTEDFDGDTKPYWWEYVSGHAPIVFEDPSTGEQWEDYDYIMYPNGVVGYDEDGDGTIDYHPDDADLDGVSNLLEWQNLSDSTKADTDGDGYSDLTEINNNTDLNVPADDDGDGLDNALEVAIGTLINNPDSDSDNATDQEEYLRGTDPNAYNSENDTDTSWIAAVPLIWAGDMDQDGIPDEWERRLGLNPYDTDDAALDPDDDGLLNVDEYRYRTGIHNPDTDGDGLEDGWEVANNSDPTDFEDSDHDEIPDAWEVLNGMNPLEASDALADWDDDGLHNLAEYRAGTDLLDPDTDGDHLSDGDEVNVLGTNPLLADSDGDGFDDDEEFLTFKTDPNVWNGDNGGVPANNSAAVINPQYGFDLPTTSQSPPNLSALMPGEDAPDGPLPPKPIDYPKWTYYIDLYYEDDAEGCAGDYSYSERSLPVPGIEPGAVFYEIDWDRGIAYYAIYTSYLLTEDGLEECPEGGTPGPDPRKPSVSASDRTGNKYRKIALNGMPMSDEPPEASPESDRSREQTYIDAFSLTLNHSTSDVYVPLAGSSLALEVGRTYGAGTWTPDGGLRPQERLDMPFGVSWNSNVCSYVEVTESWRKKEGDLWEQQRSTATALDENGSPYQFAWIHGEGWVPTPGATVDADAYTTRLQPVGSSSFIMTKKFGTTLTYNKLPFSQSVHSPRTTRDPTKVSAIQHTSYYRVVKVEDPKGAELNYQYPGPKTLVPSVIFDPERPNYRISISQNLEGKILAVKNPNGQVTRYEYGRKLFPLWQSYVYELRRVIRPDGTDVQYQYDHEVELDGGIELSGLLGSYESVSDVNAPALAAILETLPMNKFHANLSSITNSHGATHSFEYKFNQNTKFWENGEFPNPGYLKRQPGKPRWVSKVHLPQPGDFVSFDHNVSLLVWQAPGWVGGGDEEVSPPSMSGGINTVTDAGGYTRSYEFSEDRSTDSEDLPDAVVDPGSEHVLIDYAQMAITHPTGVTQIFEFDLDAGMALQQATDYSGNTSTYAYEDVLPVGAVDVKYGDTYVNIVPGINARYNDPTREIDALNRTTFYEYNDDRLMKKIIDPAGRVTTYTFNSKGNRTSELITGPFGGGEVRTTYHYHGVHPGFVTSKTVQAGTGGQNFVTTYVPDSQGRVFQENVGGLITTTIYDNSGNKSSVTDPFGAETVFQYDEVGRLALVSYPPTTDPSGMAHNSSKALSYNRPTADGYEEWEELTYDGNVVQRTIRGYNATRQLIYDGVDVDLDGTLVRPARDAAGGDIRSDYVYNARGAVNQATDPLGNVTVTVYDEILRPTSSTTTPLEGTAQTATFDYGDQTSNSGGSPFNLSGFQPIVTTVTGGSSPDLTTTKELDELYRLTKVTQEGGAMDDVVATTLYDDASNPKTVTDPRGKVTESVFDVLGRVLKVTDAHGTPEAIVTDNYYNAFGQVWKSVVQNTLTTTSDFDAAGRVIAVHAPEVDDELQQPVIPETTTEYRDAERLVIITDPKGKKTRTYNDERGQVIRVVTEAVDIFNASAPLQTQAETFYGAFGPVRVVGPDNAVSTSTYDAAGRVTDGYAPAIDVFDTSDGLDANGDPVVQQGIVPHTQTSYDSGGNALTVTDANGKTIQNEYDGFGNLLKTIGPGPVAERIETSFEYDNYGNQVSVTDGEGAATAMAYDALGRLLATTYPDGKAQVNEYDSMVLTKRTDANLKETDYTYDPHHRLKTVTYVGTPTPRSRSYVYDDFGRLTSVTETGVDHADVAYTYDSHGRVTSGTSNGVTHSHVYDIVGNRMQTVYGNNGLTISSTYDNHHRLKTMSENGRTTVYEYDVKGNVVLKELPNGQAEYTEFDAGNRRTSTSTFATNDLLVGDLLYKFEYLYDKVGNVRHVVEEMDGKDDRAVFNEYDDNHRLEKETITEGTTVTFSEYEYDRGDNRTKLEKDTDGDFLVDEVYDYDYVDTDNFRLNQLQSFTRTEDGSLVDTISFTYDDNGNRLTRTDTHGTDNYGYDRENRLIQLDDATASGVETYKYTYDYRTRRVMRDEPGDIDALSFADGTSAQEYHTDTDGDLDANARLIEYVRGSDWGGGVGGILYTLRGTTPSFNHYNSRGDVVAKTDSTGTETWQASYEAFGTRTRESGATDDRQKANTKDEDPHGLLNEGFRYRDLEAGVFITRDPLGFVDGPNMYSYVRQNPWTYFDPLGLETKNELVNQRDSVIAERDAYIEEQEASGAKRGHMTSGSRGGVVYERSEYGKQVDAYNKTVRNLDDRMARIEETQKYINDRLNTMRLGAWLADWDHTKIPSNIPDGVLDDTNPDFQFAFDVAAAGSRLENKALTSLSLALGKVPGPKSVPGTRPAIIGVSKGGQKSTVDLLKDLPGSSGKQGMIRVVDSEGDMSSLFNTMTRGGKKIDSGNYPGVVKRLPDGTVVRMRSKSKSGGTTMDITMPDGRLEKVHVQQ